MKQHKKNRSQAGEAELGFFMIVVVICAIISAGLFILSWIKDTKNARVERRSHKAATDVVEKRSPGSYWADCSKPVWKLLGTQMDCVIDPESYVEKELEEYR